MPVDPASAAPGPHGVVWLRIVLLPPFPSLSPINQIAGIRRGPSTQLASCRHQNCARPAIAALGVAQHLVFLGLASFACGSFGGGREHLLSGTVQLLDAASANGRRVI